MTEHLPQNIDLHIADDAGRQAFIALKRRTGQGQIYTDLGPVGRPAPDTAPIRVLTADEVTVVARLEALLAPWEAGGTTRLDDEHELTTGTDPAL